VTFLSARIPGMVAYDKLKRNMQQLGENERDRAYLDTHFLMDYPDGKSVDHSMITDQEAFLKTPGFVGPFLYDAVASLGLASCRLVETSESNDNFSGEEQEYFTGEKLFEALVNTKFDGVSGPVRFDPDTGTRDPQSALFLLTNFVGDEDASSQGNVQFKGVTTDLFRSGQWDTIAIRSTEFDFATYIFNDGTSDVPSDLPVLEENSNYLDDSMMAVGLTLCGVIIALALMFSYWTYRNSEKQVVRSSQPIFLHIISLGTLLMGLSIIPLTIDLGVTDQKGADAACMSLPWLLVSGFSLTFSAL